MKILQIFNYFWRLIEKICGEINALKGEMFFNSSDNVNGRNYVSLLNVNLIKMIKT